MTFRFNAKHLAICLFVSTFFSCKKDDTAPAPPAEEGLFTKIQGRWDADFEVYGGPSGVSSKQQEQDNPEAQVAAVEFLGDSTFLIAFNQGMAFTGKFKATDASTIKCNTSVGEVSINDVKIVEDSISFTIPATPMTPSLSVKAAKAANLTIAEDKKALLLKDWLVEKDLADGDKFYHSSSSPYGEDTKAYFHFTSAGSLLFKMRMVDPQNPSSEPMEMIMFQNWKWDATNANTIIAVPFFGEEMATTMKITSLTSTTLEIEQSYPQSEQPSINIVLTAQ